MKVCPMSDTNATLTHVATFKHSLTFSNYCRCLRVSVVFLCPCFIGFKCITHLFGETKYNPKKEKNIKAFRKWGCMYSTCRPPEMKWTCESINPGTTTFPLRSNTWVSSPATSYTEFNRNQRVWWLKSYSQ